MANIQDITEDVRRWQTEGDKPACGRVLAAFTLALHKIANQFYPTSGWERDDLLQVGRVALVEAMNTFDHRKSTFSTYAIATIYYGIRKALRGPGARLIHIPDEHRTTCRRIDRTRADLYLRSNRRPTDAEVAAATGLTEEGVKRHDLTVATVVNPLSLDTHFGGQNGWILDATANPDNGPDDITDDITDCLNRLEAADVILAVRGIVPERDWGLFCRYFGIGRPPETLGAIGKSFGITHQAAKQRLDRALARARQRLTDTSGPMP